MSYPEIADTHRDPGFTRVSRRQLMFWCGLGIASLGHRLDADATEQVLPDRMPLNATVGDDIDQANDSIERQIIERQIVEHWTAAGNTKWRWYERENLVDNSWKKTGITTPIDRESGDQYTDRTGYIDESEIPASILSPKDRIRLGHDLFESRSWQDRYAARKPIVAPPLDPETIPIWFGDRSASDAGRSAAERRGRHGRPPSEWLRSLTTEEIRTWLAKVEIQDAHVRGMTFWTHLTRDHLFDPTKIKGLTESELAELHGAAHEGF